MFRFNNSNYPGSCPHICGIKEKHMVRLVPAEGAGDALRNGPGQKHFHAGKCCSF